MNKSNIIISIAMSIILIGCSNSTKQVSSGLDMEKYPKKRSLEWCQKQYYSASASHKDRKVSAKHCDAEARQAYVDSKDNKKEN